MLAMSADTRIPAILGRYESELLDEWLRAQKTASTLRADLLSEAELREQCRDV